MEACGACGRMVSDEQLASHERVCPAWRRKVAVPEAPEGPDEPKGPTGGSEE